MSTLVDEFKAAFRGHPAGIALITAQTAYGPVGLTVSSLASVSVDPPALSFSVTRIEGSAGGVLGAPTFLVHLLASEHADLAETFARSNTARFTAAQGWDVLPTGEPYLPSAPVALQSRALSIVPVGSSRLVIAEVLASHRGPDSPPLIYHDRRFRSLLQTEPV